MNGESQDNFNARCYAYHESGHAVAAIQHGMALIGIDIRPQFIPGLGLTLGCAEITFPPPTQFLGMGEDAVMPILVVLFAGAFAEQRINSQAGLDIGHAQSDGQRATKYAAGAICEPVLQNGILTTPGGVVMQNLPQIEACLEKARQHAQDFVTNHGAVIDAVAEVLAQVKVLTSDEVMQLIEEASTAE